MIFADLLDDQQWLNVSLPFRMHSEWVHENCLHFISTYVLLPGKSHGWRRLVGCSPWGCLDRTRLSDFTFTFHFHALEKAMASHPSVLAWRIPGTGEPGGLPSMGSHKSDTTEVT